jgi:F-type H+-transporting ATPase subunit b
LAACWIAVLSAAFVVAQEEDDPKKSESNPEATQSPAKDGDADHKKESSEASGHGAGDAADHGAADHAAEDHGGGHHDPTDLGHQNTSGKAEDVMNFRADLAVWTFIIFLVLLALLFKGAWGPIMDGLQKREDSIAAMIDEAKQSSEQAADQLKEYEAKLAAAGEEARGIVAQSRKDAETAGERIVAEAQQSAQRERERAVADIANAKNAALEEISDKSVDIAVQLAGRIVNRELNSQDHSQLIREALDQLPSRN